MEFQSVQHTIDKLIQWIRSGRLALPDFQRDFVWNPGRVVELLDSVAKQWPIGSLLLLSGPQPFGIRAIADAPPLKGRMLDYYILDGQQRLTSLYHSIGDVSDFCYFVDFAALARDEEDYIRWEKRKVFQKKYPELRHRATNSVALIKDIWELDAFYRWLEAVSDPLLKRNYVSLRDKRLGGLQAKVYKLMAIELDQEIQLEALARIFETLNRTGVKLNAFDLMVAMLYPTGFHLRDKWEEAKLNHEMLDRYGVDPIEVLKLAALIVRTEFGRKEAKGVRQGNLLELDRDLLRQTWDQAVHSYAAGLDFARRDLGVFCSDAVPSWSMLLGVCVWLSRPDAGEKAIVNWFFGSGFAQTYFQAANTVIVSDVDALNRGMQEELEARVAEPFPVLDESPRKNGLALRTLGCFLARRGALDPVSGELLMNCSTLSYRVISGDGRLAKLADDESFAKVIFMSRESDRALSKMKLSELTTVSTSDVVRERLETQLIDLDFMERDLSQLKALAERSYQGRFHEVR